MPGFQVDIKIGDNEFSFETTDGTVTAETMDQIIRDVKTVFGPDAEAVPSSAPVVSPPVETPPPAPDTTVTTDTTTTPPTGA